MADDEQKAEFWESKYYYKLGEALTEVRSANGAKETAISSAKLVGKFAFNAGLFAGKLGVEFIKDLPAQVAKQNARTAERALRDNPNLPQDKREFLQSVVDKGK